MDAKQYATKQPMGQWRNQKGNLKNERNENGKTMIQNLWDPAKAVLRGNFIAILTCLRKQEKSQTI